MILHLNVHLIKAVLISHFSLDCIREKVIIDIGFVSNMTYDGISVGFLIEVLGTLIDVSQAFVPTCGRI
jgi:hypothetical protein